MAVFKATDKKSDSAGKFKATEKRSYDSALVYDWDTRNKEARDILEQYRIKVNNGGYLSADDLATYKKALDSYEETSNGLRSIAKVFGSGNSMTDVTTWGSTMSKMRKNYQTMSEYYSKWKTEDDYKAAIAQAEKDERLMKELLGDYDPEKNKQDAQTAWGEYQQMLERIAQNKAKAEAEKSGFVKAVEHLGTTPQGAFAVDMNQIAEGYIQKDINSQKPDDRWSEEQQLAYAYLWKHNRTKAGQYAIAINNRLDAKQEQEQLQKIQDWATDNFGAGVVSTVGAVLSSQFGLADYLGDIIQQGAVGYVDEYDGNVSLFEYSQAVTGGISQHLNELGGTLDEDIPIIGGKGWGDVYGLNNSILQSALAAYTGGGGQALITAFGSAAASGVDDAIKRGASGKQAVLYGTAVGAAEAVAEKIGVDNLMKIGSSATLKQLFINIIKQGGAEGIEEGITSVLGNVADNIVMGDKSNFYLSVEAYMNAGMNEDDAKRKAWSEMVGDIIYDSAAGFVSGAVHAGPQTTYQTLVQNADTKNTYGGFQKELVGEALEIDPGNAFAQKMQGRLDNGKNLSGSQLNKLVRQNTEGITALDMSSIQTAAETRLTELGETGDVATIAAALAKQAAGERLSKAEQQAIANSKYGQRVANELNPENIRSGGYSSAWAEQIDTNRINAQEYSRLVEAAQLPQETAEVTGVQVVPQSENVAQGQQVEVVENPTATIRENQMVETQQTTQPANDQQVTGKLTGKESLQVVEEAAEEPVTLESASQKYGAQAKAMIHTYQAGQDVAKFDKAYQAAYDMGRSGVALSYALNSEATSYLTEAQKGLAYEAGEAASNTAAHALDAKNKASANGKTGRKKGTVRGEGVTISDLKQTFNDTQGKAYKYLSTVAEVTGIDIVLYRSEAGPDGKFQGAQGRYRRSEPGTIYIDLNAGLSDIKSVDDLAKYAMLRTFAHEFTHFIENWNPIQYNELRKVVFDTLTQRGENVQDLIEDKQARNPGMDYDKASREVVAEAMTDILPDVNFVQELAQKHKNIFTKLLEKLKEFVQNLRDYFNSIGHNRSREANALKEQVGETVKYLDSIVQLFDNVAVQAVENYQQTVATEEVAVAENETTTTVSKTEIVATTEEETPAVGEENAPTETDAYGFTISDNVEHGSLEITFDSKPSEAVRDVLKENKFRWHKTKKVWYGYGNRADIQDALRAAYESETKPAESVTKPADTVTETPEAVTEATETVTNQVESVLEHRTPAEAEPAYDPNDPYNRLAYLLGRRSRFEHGNFVYRVLKAGPDNSMWQGHIDAAEISASGVYVANARGIHYTSELYENRDDARDDIIATARASKLLDEKPTETTKPKEEVTNNGQNADNQGAVPQYEPDGSGTARLLDEVEAGNVPGDGGSGDTLGSAAERGPQIGRDGDRPDTQGSRSGSGEGSSQSGDLRGSDRVTIDGGTINTHAAAKEYAEGKGYRIELNKLSAKKNIIQVDIYDKQGIPTFNPIIIGELGKGNGTAGWNKVKEAIDKRETAENEKSAADTNVGDKMTPAAEDTNVPSKEAEKLHEEVVEQIAQQSTEKPKGRNFVIGDSLDLPSGEKARYKANIDAIRLVKQLEAEGRYATEAEQVILSKYVGWGGLANAFSDKKADWAKEYTELKELLTDEEYSSARGSTLNAHYTDISVIKAMYDGLKQLGFTGGRMMEPSSGVGNFVGAMPADMAANVRSWTMVELDGITGLIAKYLYPNADVRIQGFEKANIPNNFMDVAISNVPFGNYAIADKTYPKKVTSAIHNYFFAKSLDKVRPGGIVMFITSSYTMNSKDETVRRYIMQKADLLGAIRLPDNAFKGNAGTEVVTDILVLKKRAANTAYAGEDFLEAPYKYISGYNGAYINSYFENHPEMVLGTPTMSGGMYRSDSLTYKALEGRGSLADQIREAFKNIQGKLEYPAQRSPEKTNFAVERADKKTKENGLVVKDGKVYKNTGGELIEQTVSKGTAERIAGMLEIRDAAKALQTAQQQGLKETEIK